MAFHRRTGMQAARLALLLLVTGAAAEGPRAEIRGMRHPALSPDGKRIAFAYHGDIWICPSEGGAARRITADPAHEQKPSWSPDGRCIAFSGDQAGNSDLYVIEIESGRVRQLTFHSSGDDAPAWSPDGKWIAFQSNRDSNMDLCLNDAVWDVWRMPAGGGTASRVTRFRGENPAWSPDGQWIAYDRYSSGYADGQHNIFVIASDGSGLPRELAAGEEDSRHPTFRGNTVYFAHEANGIRTSPFRNLWRTTTAGGALLQVTAHRGDHVTWPTACEKSSLVVYEYDFDLYSVDAAERSPAPRKLRIEADPVEAGPPVIRTLASGFQSPSWSPSGSRIAFACRGDVWTASVEGGEARPLACGEDEEGNPSWSSDGKTIVYVSNPWGGPGHVYAAGAEGGEPRRLTREEGHYRSPRLSPDGSRLLASRAEGGETDLWIFDLDSKEGRPLSAEKGVEEGGGCFSADGKTVAFLSTRRDRTNVVLLPPDGGPPEILKTEASVKSGLAWSPDGLMLAYGSRQRDGNWALRVLEVKEQTERTVARGARAPCWSPDSTMLLCESPGGRSGGERTDSQTLGIYDSRSAQRLSVEIRATRPVTAREEMKAVFRQVWGTYDINYYDPFFHGVDMAALREKYGGLAADCRTKAELYGLINDMILELRSSHVHLRPPPTANSVVTGALAAELRPQEDGTLVLGEIEPDGPAAKAGLRAGETIVAVRETDLIPGSDFDRLMSGAAGAGIPEVKLAVRDAAGDIRSVFARGLSRTALRELKDANRAERLKKFTAERSGGRLGYFHLRFMVDKEVARLRTALEKEFAGCEGLVLDERDGVGGMAHRPICSLLDSTAAERLDRYPACFMRNRNGWTGPDKYATGGGRTTGKSWDRPVIMIQNEVSRSDKEILPFTFRHLGIGYLVGMPTAGGVIGGNEWTMQDGSKIMVSTQGWFTSDGRNMEGWGVPPDFRVPERHEDLYAGRDVQLEKAVEVLMAQMDGKIAAPTKPGAALKDKPAGGR